MEEKKKKFLKKCEEWFEEYKSGNLDKLTDIADELNRNTHVLSRYTDCIKENNVIQNMTSMIKSTSKVLTENQQRLCQVI